MPSLSLCMIVRNEADYLEECLDSVKDIVDEIIIVDTGSTDSTKEIAKRFNAKIIEHKWNNDFSEARNISLAHATKDWILVIDADETISKKDLPIIKELIKNNEYDGYMLIQRTYTNNSTSQKWVTSKNDVYDESKHYAGWIYSGITRLFKNKKEIRFEYPVHETVKEAIKRRGGKIGITEIPIHHYGKVRSKDYVSKKSEMYLELGKRKVQDKETSKAYYELGVQSQVLGKLDEAIGSFKKVIKLNPQMISAYVNLGSIYLIKGRYTEATDILEKGNKINPNNSNLHNNLGIVYEKTDENKAIEEFKLSISLNPNNAEPHWNLARIYTKQQNFNEAAILLKRAIEINPKNILAYSNLGGLYLKLNKSKEAIDILKRAIEIDPKNPDLYSNLAIIYLQKNSFDKSLENLEKALTLNPKNKEEIKKKIEMIKRKKK